MKIQRTPFFNCIKTVLQGLSADFREWVNVAHPGVRRGISLGRLDKSMNVVIVRTQYSINSLGKISESQEGFSIGVVASARLTIITDSG